MKRIIFLLLFLIFIQKIEAKDFYQYCSTNTPKKTFSGTIVSLSGLNSLTRNIAENEIQRAIKKETNAKFKIKIENFFATNLLNGEIKSIQASSKKYDYDGIHLTDIDTKTICSYNRIEFKDEKLYFRENMVLKYSTFLTQDDLNKTINSQKIDKTIAKILNKISKYNLILPIAKTLKALNIPIKIDEYNSGKLFIDDIKTIDSKIKIDGHIVIFKTN